MKSVDPVDDLFLTNQPRYQQISSSTAENLLISWTPRNCCDARYSDMCDCVVWTFSKVLHNILIYHVYFFFIWTKNNITDPLIIPTLLRLQSFRRICFKFAEIWNLILTKNYNCPKGLVVYPIPPCAPSQFFKSGLLRILFFFSLLLYIPWLTYLLPFMRHRTFG